MTERTTWRKRQLAFAAYYGLPADVFLALSPAEERSRWATLMDLDKQLSAFRLKLDGYSGAGWAQMANQRARCEA